MPAKQDAHEQDLQILLDKEAIRDVISKYSFNVDIKRVDNALRLWTDDGIFVTDFNGQPVDLMGKESIKEFLTDPDKDPLTQHLQIDIVVEVSGDDAYAVDYQVIPVSKDGIINIVRCSFRSFNLRRVNGNWLICKASSKNLADTAGCQSLIPENW